MCIRDRVGPVQNVFTGNFISGIKPIRILSGRAFRYHKMGGRRLIYRSRADKNILPAFPAEQIDIPLRFQGRKTYKFGYHVKIPALHSRLHGLGVTAVRLQPFYAFRKLSAPAAPVHTGHLPALFQGQADTCGADRSRSADKQSF